MSHDLFRFRLGTAARAWRDPRPFLDVWPAQEAVYQAMFERDMARLGVGTAFYPVGSAANYGLLYVIARLCQEHPIATVVELGAGQTSILLDRLRQAGVLKAEVLTIEHDPGWAARVQAQVTHSVKLVPLRAQEDESGRYEGYDLAALETPPSIDLLVIDGPPSAQRQVRFARHGALGLIDRLNPAGFAVVVDDAERFGEAYLARRIEQGLRGRGLAFRVGAVVAAKRQTLIAGGSLEGAAFL